MAGKSFQEKLKFGKGGERVIAAILCKRGYSILPIEKEDKNGKGPRIYQASSSIVAPDLLALEFGWIEAKTKSAFTWHRITKRWTTGIDIYYYEQYVEAASLSSVPTYLFFLQLLGQAKDSPPDCPTGLFYGELQYLRVNENHRSDRWGKGGMVYWSVDKLKKLAELDELDSSFLHSGEPEGQSPPPEMAEIWDQLIHQTT